MSFRTTNLMFGGAPLPILRTGRYILPTALGPGASGGTIATTGARYYIAPIYIPRQTTFAGAWCFNGGAGDNGDKGKIAIYSESSSGGPGSRSKDFGEITFTGAAALRNFASSWTAAPGQYYLEFVTDNAVTMYSMTPVSFYTTVGSAPFAPTIALGQIGMGAPASTGDSNTPQGDYVGGTYANFPESTSLTPATTLLGKDNMPMFGLYT